MLTYVDQCSAWTLTDEYIYVSSTNTYNESV